jgi:hypothetical protein
MKLIKTEKSFNVVKEKGEVLHSLVTDNVIVIFKTDDDELNKIDDLNKFMMGL